MTTRLTDEELAYVEDHLGDPLRTSVVQPFVRALLVEVREHRPRSGESRTSPASGDEGMIDPETMVAHCRRLVASNERAHVDPDTIAMATYIINGAHERDRLRTECARHEENVSKSFAQMKDVTETLDKMGPVVDGWRQVHGEEIAKELIRAYLDGVNDALSTLMALGAGAQHVLYERLRGN